MGLGSLNDFTLAEAREQARECRQQRARGVDPIEARDAAEQANRIAQLVPSPSRIVPKNTLPLTSPWRNENIAISGTFFGTYVLIRSSAPIRQRNRDAGGHENIRARGLGGTGRSRQRPFGRLVRKLPPCARENQAIYWAVTARGFRAGGARAGALEGTPQPATARASKAAGGETPSRVAVADAASFMTESVV